MQPEGERVGRTEIPINVSALGLWLEVPTRLRGRPRHEGMKPKVRQAKRL